MAEPGPDVPTYSFMEAVSTLGDLPNVKHSADAVAIRIPDDDGGDSDSTTTDITYGKLKELVEATATILSESAGLGAGGVPGDVVSIVFPNEVSFVLSFLAVPYTRSVSAPLNQNYTREEYKFYMEDNESKLVLVPEAGGGVPEAEMAAEELGLPVYAVGWNEKDGVSVKHKSGPKTIARSSSSESPADEVGGNSDGGQEKKKAKLTFEPRPSDVALFLHTSGTTAKPKGVPLAHSNLVASMNNISRTYRLTPDDAVLLIMPLFHVHGLMSALLSTLATGGTVVLPPQPKFSASKFWHNATAGKATWVTCVPTIYQVLLLRFDKDAPKQRPKFRFVRSCSSALAPSVLTEIEEKFGAPCVEAYAMTEASHQMCSNPIIDGPRKPGTVGKGTGVSVAILDEDNKVISDPDVEGEVCIRGKNVTKGYLGVTNEVNEEAFAGGWFHTGDRGKLDSEGYLTLTGRIKELINRGGEKISPLEVDAAMLSHPSVAEAVAFGMPHDMYGEVPAAAIVLKDGKDMEGEELREYLKGKIAPFKIPAKVFFDEELPKTATGKIQRRIVAAHFLK